MSSTWNASSGNDEWTTSAPTPAAPRRQWRYTQIKNGTTNEYQLTFGVERLTEAKAQTKVADFNRTYGPQGYSFTLVDPTSTQASQSANGQKAPTPMKLTFARTALITSLQAVVDSATAKVADLQAKFDAATVAATAVVDANAQSIASGIYGFPNDADGAATFKKSPSYKLAIQNMAANLGLPSYAPVKANTKATEALIATLNLATDTNLEIEEGHQFIQHLRNV